MQVQVQSVNFDADQKLIQFIKMRIGKLSIFFDNIIDSEVYLKIDRANTIDNKIVESINETNNESIPNDIDDKIYEKQIPVKNKIKKNTSGKFFSYLVVSIISFAALIILIDTLKVPLINVFPDLEILLFNLFEILKDIKLFIIDLY